MSMLDLYFIRHAESQRNLEPHLIGGRSFDFLLFSLGKKKASFLGKRLASQGVFFQHVSSSTAVRCRETAVVAGQDLGFSLQDIVFSDQLLELDQGQWEGQPRMQIYTPKTLAQINSNNWEFTPPRGESQKTVEERMLAFIQTNILPLYREGIPLTCGIFSHGVAIKCLLRGIMGFTPRITYKILLDNTSITRLQYDGRGWHLLSVNDTAHLFGKPTENT